MTKFLYRVQFSAKEGGNDCKGYEKVRDNIVNLWRCKRMEKKSKAGIIVAIVLGVLCAAMIALISGFWIRAFRGSSG